MLGSRGWGKPCLLVCSFGKGQGALSLAPLQEMPRSPQARKQNLSLQHSGRESWTTDNGPGLFLSPLLTIGTQKLLRVIFFRA